MTSERRRRLVIVCTGLGLGGGAGEQIRALAGRLHRRRWTVTIVSLLPVDDSLPELEACGVVVLDLGMRRGLADPRAILRLGRILRRLRPHVVHAHQVHANLLARVTRLVAPVPVLVSTIHNENEGSQWRYWAYRATDRLSNATTAVSEMAAAGAVARGAAAAGSIVVVPNGIDTSRHRPDESLRATKRRELQVDDRFVWLAVGRLTAAKAYEVLIEAVAALPLHPHPVVMIAGDGPLASVVERRVAVAGVTESVRLLGLRADVPELMQAADAFVLSSAWEGLPMVLLEAASAGLPIVATDVGGTREVVVDGLTGSIVRPGDPPALGRAMADLMARSTADRRAMGAAGRSHVANQFELERVVDRWEQLYEELAAGRGRG